MYNNVRRIARARNGSQIPKYKRSGILKWINDTGDKIQNGLNKLTNQEGDKGIELNKSGIGSTTPVQKFASSAIDTVSSTYFQNTENSAGFDVVNKGINGVSDLLMGVNPALGLAAKGIGLGLNIVNDTWGKKSSDFSVDQQTTAQVGGSYGGSMEDITNAASKAGTKYGLFSSKARKKANSAIADAKVQQNKMAGIANIASDMQAMAGNNLNYLNYAQNLDGGYDHTSMRAAKYGMKISDKIDLIKQRTLTKQVVNVDTRRVEEFKQGGTIEQPWEPEIDSISDYWEPIIIDCVEEFKDGGSIKEESSESIETSQKNLIPEGALHKNKHHIEHTEGLTQKGIPVVDNDGNQQAEIECDELILNLEVTKAIEEKYDKFYSDEVTNSEKDYLAIEIGKLLVEQILYNTEDMTSLIEKVQV